MELKDYLKIIGRSWVTILGLAAAVAILTLAWSLLTPIKYESSAAVVVNKPNPVPQRGANYYQYDKFYSIQASSLQADTLTAWLSSAGTAKEIYEQAGLPVPEVNLKKLSKIFKPRRLPPATLNVTVADRDKARAEKLVTAAVDILEKRTEDQRKADDPDHYFNLLTSRVVTAPAKPDLMLNIVLGLIGGLILGLMTAFLKEYLRR